MLRQGPGRGAYIAGGTELRRDAPGCDFVVDINHAGIDTIDRHVDGDLFLGAAVTLAQAAAAVELRDFAAGAVAGALAACAHRPGRTGATIGGHICHPSRCGDVAPVLLALDAECVVAGETTVAYLPLGDLYSRSGGTTLRDNHLRPLVDGNILESQACLIANRPNLKARPGVLAAGRQLLEYIEAHLRAQNCYLVLANIRGESPEAVSRKMFEQPHLAGLQGPTISPVIPADGMSRQSSWYAVNIIVRKPSLTLAIAELRAIGGSGVVVSPVTYIFEEEPERSRRLLAALES